MSDAYETYRVAERLISEAKEIGADDLSLDRRDCRALTHLPPQIADLPALRTLDLGRTQITDLSPLSDLTALRELVLDYTKVTDLSPLSNLTSLTELGLGWTSASDLTPLSGLNALSRLWLHYAKVSDLSPLFSLALLTGLRLDDNPVTDLSPLSGLKGLRGLSLTDVGVSFLDPLSGLSELTALWLDRTPVYDLSPLSGLTNLSRLALDEVPATDFRPLLQLRLLASNPSNRGLSFRGSGATRVDARIDEIANIADDTERAESLFLHLKSREPRTQSSLGPETSPAQPPFVFLSYAHTDRARAESVRAVLSASAIPIWWDQDILAGAEWRQTIANQLQSANTVLTCWTAHSTQSKPVIEEAATAQNARKLVHFRLDDTPLPYGFAETQYLNLHDWDGTPTHPKMRQLVQALKDRLNPPTPAELAARLTAANPIQMVVEQGRLSPRDTPIHTDPEIVDPADRAARIAALRLTVKAVSAKAADRDHYQVPEDLRHDLRAMEVALRQRRPSWYSIHNSCAALRGCMNHHGAEGTWNAGIVLGLNQVIAGVEDLRPLLQPRQLPQEAPEAKPPEPLVLRADPEEARKLAADLQQELASPDALAILDPAAIQLTEAAIAAVQSSAPVAATPNHEGLRRGIRGMTYAVGATVAAISTGVIVNLLTAPDAALTLVSRLRPLLDRLVAFFL